MMQRRTRVPIVVRLADRLREEGSWCGETHVQKATYFLQELGEVPLGFEFVLYRHGPFSFDLRDELTAIRAAGFFSLKRNPIPYGPSLEVTETGQSLETSNQHLLATVDPAIDFVATRLGDSNVARLERLATSLMIAKEEPEASIEERANHLVELKPHISLDSARDAVGEVDRMLSDARGLLPLH